MSFHPLTRRRFTQDLLADRAFKIAQHEICHALELDHHAYEDGIDCTMVGDVTIDSTATLDDSEAGFCADGGAHVEHHIRRNARSPRGGRS